MEEIKICAEIGQASDAEELLNQISEHSIDLNISMNGERLSLKLEDLTY